MEIFQSIFYLFSLSVCLTVYIWMFKIVCKLKYLMFVISFVLIRIVLITDCRYKTAYVCKTSENSFIN